MLYYAIYLSKRAMLQVLCNFIPFKNLRKKARNALYDKFIGDILITLDKVDSFLPSAVLSKINAYDNKHFALQNQNTNTTINTNATRERERVITPLLV